MPFITKAKLYRSLLISAWAAGPVTANTIDDKIKRLEQSLDNQQAHIVEQERKLNSQATIISEQKKALDDQRQDLDLLQQEILLDSRGRGPAENNQAQQPTPVGQAPAKTQQSKPQVEGLADIGGVLTRKGTLVLEPSVQYAHSDVNRLTFRGIEILSSLGIGLLEAVDADRDTVIASLTGRLGLTNRLELELKVPYVYRNDEETVAIPQVEETNISDSLYGDGMGDIEIALHYQLNNGLDGWPFFIANARVKLNNGEGPFDIPRTSEGIGTELATGSGFYSFEPSITALFPSAPAVFFSNLGYLINFEEDIDKTFGEQTIGKVKPGDAVRFSFGMAYSINERAAFTLGFKTDFIQESDTEINGVTLNSSSLTIGSMLMGYSYQLTNDVGINLNLELGVTDDAPDMLVTFRVPFTVGSLWR
tara:strand:- start:2050 stop:3312 length:1263 start_codon:yes stop_codon:yes gene_type:complete